MQELIDIIEEEAEITETQTRAEETTKDTLYTAARKISESGPVTILTSTEKAAVRHALEDVGELYLFAGTSAGFDVATPKEEREYQSRGHKARAQAASLGIYL